MLISKSEIRGCCRAMEFMGSFHKAMQAAWQIAPIFGLE